jgi:hypothetical protein
MELLIVVSIIALLLAIMTTALRGVRSATKSFVCKNNLRTVAFEFGLFADDYARGDRGDSDQGLRAGFSAVDFQESVYKVDEFWDLDEPGTATYRPSKQPLICPAGPQRLERQSGQPCQSAVNPQENVSVAFNMRLAAASVSLQSTGWWVFRDVRLTPRILEHPDVPLAFDVDGVQAVDRRKLPFYSAPAVEQQGLYANDQFWFPSLRHGRKVNACFVGGYVLSSSDPVNESGWDWRYQPRPED